MTQTWRSRLLRSRIAENIVALMSTQIAAYLFPLATVPYLARVLGPFHWGVVAFAQALGLYLAMVVDFGFQLSASRKIARIREDSEQVAQVVSGVLGAKLLLAGVCVAAVSLLQRFSPFFQEDSLILWGGALSGIGQGFSMMWLYQGFERMRAPAVAEVAGKAVSCLGIFLFVRGPGDAWMVLTLQCCCFACVAAVQIAITYRRISFRWPTLIATSEAIRDSAVMFLFRSSVSLYTTANALILGVISSAVAVGFYSGAERVIKALSSLMVPVSQTLYPRISRLVATDLRQALWLTRVSLGLLTIGAACLTTATVLAAPLIVRVLLGVGYENAVPALRVLSLLLPPIAVSTVLGIQWMLPLGMEGAYNTIVILAGIVNVGLAVCWASRWQQIGMAWSVVVTEYLVMVAICAVLAHRGMNPISGGAMAPPGPQKQFANSSV